MWCGEKMKVRDAKELLKFHFLNSAFRYFRDKGRSKCDANVWKHRDVARFFVKKPFCPDNLFCPKCTFFTCIPIPDLSLILILHF